MRCVNEIKYVILVRERSRKHKRLRTRKRGKERRKYGSHHNSWNVGAAGMKPKAAASDEPRRLRSRLDSPREVSTKFGENLAVSLTPGEGIGEVWGDDCDEDGRRCCV